MPQICRWNGSTPQNNVGLNAENEPFLVISYKQYVENTIGSSIEELCRLLIENARERLVENIIELVTGTILVLYKAVLIAREVVIHVGNAFEAGLPQHIKDWLQAQDLILDAELQQLDSMLEPFTVRYDLTDEALTTLSKTSKTVGKLVTILTKVAKFLDALLNNALIQAILWVDPVTVVLEVITIILSILDWINEKYENWMQMSLQFVKYLDEILEGEWILHPLVMYNPVAWIGVAAIKWIQGAFKGIITASQAIDDVLDALILFFQEAKKLYWELWTRALCFIPKQFDRGWFYVEPLEELCDAFAENKTPAQQIQNTIETLARNGSPSGSPSSGWVQTVWRIRHDTFKQVCQCTNHNPSPLPTPTPTPSPDDGIREIDCTSIFAIIGDDCKPRVKKPDFDPQRPCETSVEYDVPDIQLCYGISPLFEVVTTEDCLTKVDKTIAVPSDCGIPVFSYKQYKKVRTTRSLREIEQMNCEDILKEFPDCFVDVSKYSICKEKEFTIRVSGCGNDTTVSIPLRYCAFLEYDPRLVFYPKKTCRHKPPRVVSKPISKCPTHLSGSWYKILARDNDFTDQWRIKSAEDFYSYPGVKQALASGDTYLRVRTVPLNHVNEGLTEYWIPWYYYPEEGKWENTWLWYHPALIRFTMKPDPGHPCAVKYTEVFELAKHYEVVWKKNDAPLMTYVEEWGTATLTVTDLSSQYPTPTPSPRPSPSPAPTPTPTPVPIPTPIPSPTPNPTPIPSPIPSPSPSPTPYHCEFTYSWDANSRRLSITNQNSYYLSVVIIVIGANNEYLGQLDYVVNTESDIDLSEHNNAVYFVVQIYDNNGNLCESTTLNLGES